MSRSRREREVTLAIVSREPHRVADEIADLEELEKLRLARRSDQQIRDVYYDSPERVLQAKKLALRVRHIGSNTYIALKGPERVEDGGPTSRSELEARSSVAQLERIAGRLQREGVDLALRVGKDEEKALRQSGLAPIQDRETLRRRRRVDSGSQNGVKALAELAIDCVVYSIEGAPIRHYAIEIESVGLRGIETLAQLADALRGRWGDALRDWKHSKLVTGFALEELSASGKLRREHIGPQGILAPEAYELLDSYLRSRG